MITDILAVAVGLGVFSAVVLVVALRSSHSLPLLVSYALHLLIGVGMHAALGLWAPDAFGYDRRALALLSFWSGDSAQPPQLSVGKEGFVYILAGMYGALGHVPVVAVFMNAAASALLVPIVADTARRVGAPPRRAAWIVALFPAFLFWGSLVLREALVWLAIAGFVWCLVAMLDRITATRLALVLVSMGALFWLRGTAAILIGASGLLVFALARRGRGILPAATVALVVLVSPLISWLRTVTDKYELEDVNRSRNALTTLADSGFPTVSFDDPASVVAALPELLPRVLFGPFPWEWPTLGFDFGLDALGWMVLLVLVVRGRNRLRPGFLPILVVPAVVILLALAVTSGNYGTMQRLRLLSALTLIPVAAAGTLPRSSRIEPVRPLRDTRSPGHAPV